MPKVEGLDFQPQPPSGQLLAATISANMTKHDQVLNESLVAAAESFNELAFIFSSLGSHDMVESLDEGLKRTVVVDIKRGIQLETLHDIVTRLNQNQPIEDLVKTFERTVKKRFEEDLADATIPQRWEEHQMYKDFQLSIRQGQNPNVVIEEDDGNDSDEVQVETQTISFTCPITKRKFVDPVKNIACGHTYSRAAIEQMLKGHQSIECPNQCSKYVTKKDLVPDKEMARRLLASTAVAEEGPDFHEL